MCADDVKKREQLRISKGRMVTYIVIFRLVNALCIQTYFSADEFYQGPEVSHRLVFGTGVFTWEWLEGIRGITHPLLFAAVYWLVHLLGLDTPWIVANAPKLVQASLGGLGDYFTWSLASYWFNADVAWWALLAQTGNWFNFYCLPRPYSNSLESVLTISCIAQWVPLWKDERPFQPKFRREILPLLLGSFCVAIRPTSAILWAFVGVTRLMRLPSSSIMTYVVYLVLPIVGTVIGIASLADRWFYGYWVFVPFEFLRFNLIENGSAIFGINSWHWLLSQGFTTVLGVSVPLFLLGVREAVKTGRLLGILIIAWFIFTHSFAAHKEFRFLLPILPLANVYVGVGLWSLGKWLHFRKYRIAMLFLVLHVPLALYFSFVHMRGPLSIMTVLQNKIAEEFIITVSPTSIISVHFLMPCYSTPLSTYLHVDELQKNRLLFRVLDCSPRVQPKRSESERFITSPMDFVHDEYHDGALLPNFIVVFDTHAMKLMSWLESRDYIEIRRVFHSHFNGDSDSNETYRQIILFKRRTPNIQTECSAI